MAKNRPVNDPLVTQNDEEYNLLNEFRLMRVNQDSAKEYNRAMDAVRSIIYPDAEFDDFGM